MSPPPPSACPPALLLLLSACLSCAPPAPAPEAGPAYPRPLAQPPAFQPTTAPRPIVATGTVVGVWDITGGEPSRDGTAVRHALSAMGIPSALISRPSQLDDHRVLVLTGDLSESSVSAAVVDKIAAALAGGAAVLAVGPRVAALEALAGIAERTPAQNRSALVVADGDDPLLLDLRALGIRRLALGAADATVAGQGYQAQAGAAGAQVLARFEDGSAALLRKGGLYVLGLRAQYHLDLLSGLGLGFEEAYTNQHAVQGDLLPLLLRRFYLAHAPRPQVRQAAPEGRRAALILTHDCDSPASGELISGFADLERRHGVRSTFMVTTSAYSNGSLGAVYDASLLQGLRGLLTEGFDVGNHSFGHFLDFDRMPARRGGESAANYLPRYEEQQGGSQGASLFGEVQISRALLQEDLGAPVTAFRPGHLVIPPSYYEELQASGHQRSSARASGFVRTNFPYQALRVRLGGYDLYPILEYPIAISDRGLDVNNTTAMVAEWMEVVERNRITGAPTVLLLHPSSKPGRTEALGAFLAALQGRDLWIGDLRSFAAFYEAQGF